MSNDRAKYCVWLDSNKSSAVTFQPAQASLAKTNVLFNIRFPQLPKFEKFLLRLESFALQTPDTTGNPVTNVSLNRKLDASGVANPNCFKFVMPRGWSTQSMVGATEVGGNVPEPRVILGTLNASSYAGGTLMQKGVVVSRGDQPTVVVDRPNVNGTYEVVLECPDGGYFCLGDKGAPLVIGNWTACLSLTPMTNEDLKNWDGRP